jgi:hypothetical protein
MVVHVFRMFHIHMHQRLQSQDKHEDRAMRGGVEKYSKTDLDGCIKNRSKDENKKYRAHCTLYTILTSPSTQRQNQQTDSKQLSNTRQ